MQTIYFGLQCDQTYFDGADKFRLGSRVVGPIGLLRMLENLTGRSGYPDDVEFLRIEAYRKAVKATLQDDPTCFFANSFQVNEFATSRSLLAHRDELLLAGCTFETEDMIPPRLKQFYKIEDSLQLNMPIGYTERYVHLLESISQFALPIERVIVVEPLELLPSHFQRLFRRMETLGVIIEQHKKENALQSSLVALQNNLLGKQMVRCMVDDSVYIIKAASESLVATWLAKWLKINEISEPLLLIPDHKRLLDVAFQNEGIPKMGISTTSSARPSIQLLKLVTAFFWKPMDCEKIISFLLLPLNPIKDQIAFRLAAEIAKKPGYNVEDWQKLVVQFADAGDEYQQRLAFETLFLQKKYDRDSSVPKIEVLQLYQYLNHWISGFQNGQSDASVNMLREACSRLIELLESMDDLDFSFASLHHVINAIVDPIAVRVDEAEKGAIPVVFKPAQILAGANSVIWWNFVDDEQPSSFDFWTKQERAYFTVKHIEVIEIDQVVRLKYWQSIQPFFYSKQRLLLVIPASIDGKASIEHPLFPYLQATFSNLEQNIFDFDRLDVEPNFGYSIARPAMTRLASGPIKTHLLIGTDQIVRSRGIESPSSLEKFIYYPHQWFFEYLLQLRKSAMIAMDDLFTIKGNIAHRLIEQFYASKVAVEEFRFWFDTNFQLLLEAQGAVLLAYGLEPERRAFQNSLREGILQMTNILDRNGWTVVANELKVSGTVHGIEMQGIIDLVAQRGDEFLVVDIKYSGFGKRSSLVKNSEDLQLFFYQQLLQKEKNAVVSTAYFIVDQAKFITKFPHILDQALLITYRNPLEEVLHKQMTQILESIDWRRSQLDMDQVELRFKGTVKQLESVYQQEPMLNFLEMKSDSDNYDNYLTLLANNFEK